MTDDSDPPDTAPDTPDAPLLEDLEIDDLPPLAPGMPARFRERLALALKTVNSNVLAAAEASYRGTFASVHEYLVVTVSEHVPHFLVWICECLDPEKTLERYEAGQVLVWTIQVSEGEVMVFESRRSGGGLRYTVPYGNRRQTVYSEAEK